MQEKYLVLEEAIERAKKYSKENNCETSVILSRGEYYVEDGTPLIRVYEKIEAIFNNGKKVRL